MAFSSFIPDYNYYLGIVTDEESNWAYTAGKVQKDWTIEVDHTEVGCPVTFSLMREINGVRRAFNEAEDTVFAAIAVTEENQ